MADSLFCLDMGESLIKVVDVKKSNNTIDVGAIGYIETDATFYASDNEKSTKDQVSAVAKLIGSLKITKKNVNVVIPDALTYSQILLMPQLNEKELISAIRYQADQFIPMPIDETNIDIEVLQEFEKEKKILILMVAAPKKLVSKVQGVIENAGLLPDSIENELSASSRFISEFGRSLGASAGEGMVIVNIGWLSTSLYYFDPALSLLVQNHNFKIGYNLFLKEIQINTNSDPQKSMEILKTFDKGHPSSIAVDTIIAPILNEFSLELKRFITLITEKNHAQVKYLFLINEAFRFPSLPLFLQQSLTIPTKQLNPYGICTKNNLVEAHKNELSLFISGIGGNFR